MKIRKIDPNEKWSKPLFGNDAYAYDREAVLYLSVVNLRTFFGEHFLNTEVGTKWLQTVMVRPSKEKEVIAEMKRVLLSTDGVVKIYSFDYDFNDQTRIFSFNYKLVTDWDIDEDGDLVDDFDSENSDAIYYKNQDTDEAYWTLGVSRLSINTRLYKP